MITTEQQQAPEAGAYRFAEHQDIHTSDVTAPCAKTVELRMLGKVEREYTEALYRGQVAHVALEYIHQHDAWGDVEGAVEYGGLRVDDEAEREHRPLSEAVFNKRSEIHATVAKHLEHYVERRKPWFDQCKLIGVELPARVTMDLPGCGPSTFASHIDLMYRGPDGTLFVEDWKWREESPAMAYLGRNLQFAIYNLMVAYGQIQTDSVLDLWETFGEFAVFAWVDLARMKPYTRKTTVTDSNGDEVVYVKGDHRPLQNLIKMWTFDPDHEQNMLHELSKRVVMLRHGLFPMTPDPVGCFVCESRRHCPTFHGREKGV